MLCSAALPHSEASTCPSVVLVGEREAGIPLFACLVAALLLQCYWCCCGWRPIWREREGGRDHKRGLVGIGYSRIPGTGRRERGRAEEKAGVVSAREALTFGCLGEAWKLAKCGLVLGETKPRQRYSPESNNYLATGKKQKEEEEKRKECEQKATRKPDKSDTAVHSALDASTAARPPGQSTVQAT
ncbi:hypothetical protein GGI35DRAFT_25439 [Trichoderma velutinum]